MSISWLEGMKMKNVSLVLGASEETPYASTIEKIIKIEREILCLQHKTNSLRTEYREYLELHRLFQDDVEGFKDELMLILENNSSLYSFHEREEDRPVKNIKIEKLLHSLGDDNFKAGINYIYTVTIEIAWPPMMVNGKAQVVNSLRSAFECRISNYFKSINEIHFILKD